MCPFENRVNSCSVCIVMVFHCVLSLPPGVEETKEVKENLAIVVHYRVKVRCSVSFGS